jgi:Chalcone isomerase-like
MTAIPAVPVAGVSGGAALFLAAGVAASALAAPAVRDVYGVQPQLKERLDRFVEQIPDLKEGQRLTITYLPGKGTTVVVGDDEARTRIEGKDFADGCSASGSATSRSTRT